MQDHRHASAPRDIRTDQVESHCHDAMINWSPPFLGRNSGSLKFKVMILTVRVTQTTPNSSLAWPARLEFLNTCQQSRQMLSEAHPRPCTSTGVIGMCFEREKTRRSSQRGVSTFAALHHEMSYVLFNLFSCRNLTRSTTMQMPCVHVGIMKCPILNYWSRLLSC